ncbi:DUF4307 domain-containing protein [Microbacterium excoecariae]|uniref:DUF4307 domain-containing protein n=1 Tax=Microbacterium excoecariae TaxID=2715210 RepID=UPI00140CE6B2|nr:DUF4307 domain-containing protein [Microbacterium excoecariae]
MTTTAELDDRYGRTASGSRRRAWWVGGIAAIVLAVAYLGWTAYAANARAVDVDDLGFEVAGSGEVAVSFRVTSAGDEPVVCVLEALDESFGTVGWRVVELPATGAISGDHTETVRTVAEATTGFVNSCTLR